MRTVFFLLVTLISCSTLDDGFESTELISSKGEKIYINSSKWGVTSDYQATIISTDRKKLREGVIDSSEVTFRYSPFIYSFYNDTLNLYFNDEITYNVKEQFKTISINYILLDQISFNKITDKARRNEGYFLVPKFKKITYPKDMPKPGG